MALGITAARVGVAELPALRGRVEARLTALLGMPVTVARIGARLDGLTPQATLHGLRVGGEARRLTVPRLRVRLDPLASLLAGGLRVARAEALQPRLVVERRRSPAIPPAALLPEELVITDGEVVYRAGPPAEALRLTGLNARLWRNAEGLHWRAKASSAVAPGAPLVFAGDFTQWRAGAPDGRLYARATGLSPRSLVRHAPWLRPLPASANRADLGLWLTLKGGAGDALYGRIDARGPEVDSVSLGPRIGGRFAWHARAEGWRLDLAGLRFAGRGGDAAGSASLRRDAHGWRLAAANIPVAALRAALQGSGRGPPKLREWAVAARPRGSLVRLDAGYQDGDSWRLRGALDAVATAPQARWPGLSGVGLRFDAAAGSGQILAVGSKGALRLPWLFREALPFRQLDAQLSWRRDAGGWRIEAPQWRVANASGELRGGGSLVLGGDGPARIDLEARLSAGDATQASRYLPAGIMPDPLVAWLDDALQGGRVPRAELSLSGPLRRFPFRDGGGTFAVTAEVRDAALRFSPEWPTLKHWDGQLRFRRAGLRIAGDAGQIAGLRLTTAAARIADLAAPVLHVDSDISGSGNAWLGLLRRAPLTGGDIPALDRLRLTGKPQVALAMTLPLDNREAEIDGRVELSNAAVSLGDTPWRVTGLNGTVRFDEAGVAWRGLRGRFAGRPVVSRARTQPHSGGARIIAKTRFSAGARELQDGPLAALPVSGRADWRLTVEAPGFASHAEPAVRLRLDSDLRGLALAAPAPFGKPAAASTPVSASVAYADGQWQPWRLAYGQSLRAVGTLAPSAATVPRLAVRFGAKRPHLPAAPGLVLSGHLPRLPRLPLADTAVSLGALPPLRKLDLSLDTLQAGDLALRGLAIDAERRNGTWRAGFSGAATGSLEYTPGAMLRVDLKRLVLHSADHPNSPSLPTAIQPTDLPPVRLRIGSLRAAGAALGRVALDAVLSDGEWIVERLTIAGEGHTLKLSGAWGAGVRCHFTAQTDDLGAALARVGLSERVVGGHGTIAGQLRWPDNLPSGNLDDLSGELRADLADGSLPAVEPGIGRVLGLLSPALVPKRLSLDFSDATGNGLVFDTLTARVRITRGIARLRRFRITSPAAGIRVAGSVDLAERTIDQVVRVRPRVSTALPLIGGLAGGPPGAALLLLAQQAFGRELNAVGAFRYRVEGSWAEPRITDPIAETTLEARKDSDG